MIVIAILIAVGKQGDTAVNGQDGGLSALACFGVAQVAVLAVVSAEGTG